MPAAGRSFTTWTAASACLLSGAAALVYQVLWTRQLSLLLGTTVGAVAVVLAVFMGGLSLGSAAGARATVRIPPARLPLFYAALEATIAAFALAFPFLLRGATPLLAAVHGSGEPSTAALTGARVAVGMLVLLGPTVPMGATLPVLTALVARGSEGAARSAGVLYAANALGAVAGSLATVFLLLPRLGVTRASLIAAGLNGLAGGLVLIWVRAAAAPDGAQAPHAPAPRSRGDRKRLDKDRVEASPRGASALEEPGASAVAPAAVLAVAALSGLGALAHEVAWTRVLALLIGPTSYAFAFIVTSVIAGISLGSALASRSSEWLRRPGLTLAAVELLAAASSLAIVRAIRTLPLSIGDLVRDNADRMTRLMALELLGVFGFLVLPCLCFGAAFPLAVRLVAGPDCPPGAAVGRVYSWNTVGAIVGALGAGFAALPLLGLERTLVAAAGVHVLAGVVALVAATPRARSLALAGAVAAVYALGPWWRRSWDPELLSGGAYKYAAYAVVGSLEDRLRAGDLLFYRDGATATVSVKRLGATLSLAIDGKVDATSSGDMLTQRLLAHVPLLLHSAPRDVCVIGLGSGVTAGSALAHPVRVVDAVEISPEVVEAAALFRHVNRGALADPRLRVVVDDGRNHLLLSGRRYDVIISEPSNPWMAGVSALFTHDFFAMARERLGPGGLFCQWAHIYNMDLGDLKTVIAGFTDAFPHAALFLVNEGDLLLVGGRDGFLGLEPAALARRMAEAPVREDLAAVEVHGAYGFASLLALQTPALSEWVAGAERHTDDRPILEFRAPRFLHANTAGQTQAAILEVAGRAGLPEPYATLSQRATADAIAGRARMLEKAEAHDWALRTYLQALERDPRLLTAHEGLVRTALRLGRASEAEHHLERLSGVSGRIGLALLYHNLERPAEALVQLQKATGLDPRNVRALLLGAEIQAASGNPEAAGGLAQAALEIRPGDADAESHLAAAGLARGDLEGALARAEAVLRLHPEATRALEVAAIARARRGDREVARRHFASLVQAEPDGWSYLNNFGTFELESGNPAAAARLFEQATDIHPGNVAGYEGLRMAARALGNQSLLERAESMLARLSRR